MDLGKTIHSTDSQHIIKGREAAQRRKIEQEKARAAKRAAESEASRRATQERAEAATAERAAKERDRIEYDTKVQFLAAGGTRAEWEANKGRLVREAIERQRQATADATAALRRTLYRKAF